MSIGIDVLGRSAGEFCEGAALEAIVSQAELADISGAFTRIDEGLKTGPEPVQTSRCA